MENSSTQQNLETPAMFRRRPRNIALVSERTVAERPTLPDAGLALAAREEALARKEASLAALAAPVNAAFGILGSRALVILGALGAFALFGWSAAEPSGWRLGAAAAFTLFVFLPALWIDRRG